MGDTLAITRSCQTCTATCSSAGSDVQTSRTPQQVDGQLPIHALSNQGEVPICLWRQQALAEAGRGLYLSGQAASQVHGARARLVGLQPQHHRGGQLVMGSAATGLLLGDKEHNVTLGTAAEEGAVEPRPPLPDAKAIPVL